MIKPTIPITFTSPGQYDIYAQPTLENSFTTVCCIVRLTTSSEPLSTNSDLSSTRGAGMEIQFDGVFLVGAKTPVELGTHVLVEGVKLKIVKCVRRYNTRNQLDHLEIHCTAVK